MTTALRLMGFLKPYAGKVVLSILLGVATTACGIGLMGTSAYLISTAALMPSIAVLEVAIVGVRFFGISRSVFRYLERLASHSINFQLLAELRSAFYLALEPLAPAGLTQQRGGDLLNTAVRDIETLENFYVRVVAPPVSALIVTVGVTLFVTQYNPAIPWVVCSGLFVGSFGVPALTYWINREAGRSLNRQQAELRSFLVESIQGLGDLVAFGREKSILENLGRWIQKGIRLETRLVLGGSLANAMNLLITQFTLWLALWISIPYVTGGKMSGVSLAVIALIVTASFEITGPLGSAANLLGGSLESARHLFRWMDAQPEVQDPPHPSEPPKLGHLELRSVTLMYEEGREPALDQVSIDIQPGKRVAVVGASGAGKSSLVNLLLRFWDCSVGDILLDGKDLRTYRLDDVRKLFAVVPQSTYLFTGSVRYNLKMAKPQASDEELVAALQLAELSDWYTRLPQGLATWIGEQGQQLSGGERQRLSAARAILQSAPIVLLDEPAAHLDAIHERDLARTLEHITRGHSVIWITHHLVQMEMMDEIIVLAQGKVIERGKHDALIRAGNTYARMWELQNRIFS